MGQMYLLGYKKYTENKNTIVTHTSTGRIIFSANCAM